MPPPAPLPTIGTFWTGSDLSWFEQLTIQSYLDAGHHVVLYTFDEIGNIPDGTEIRDAADIGTPVLWDTSTRKGRVCFSDLFRLYMIRETGFLWSDLDAYCVKPFDWDSEYVFGYVKLEQVVNNGILRLPQASLELAACISFIEEPNPIPPWFGFKKRRQLLELRRQNTPHTVENLKWGTSGPGILTHVLNYHGTIGHTLTGKVLYPYSTRKLWQMILQTTPYDEAIPDMCHSVHLYGDTKHLLKTDFDGLPPSGTFLDQLCQKHGIDPAAAPIV
ncbi:hypothetical protein FHS89_000845 [Rubricella aquisinus]|uniref:Uncharacterized protein n=1 Tax=Rubricella aquisinus TaxID=2028108 RepID=A0A840WI96_9RHOB|nr:hypothetical protein [Rubricella aquisinus]MBB5514839.1 hypothetical protein [Rubricella aquisinus]